MTKMSETQPFDDAHMGMPRTGIHWSIRRPVGHSHSSDTNPLVRYQPPWPDTNPPGPIPNPLA